MAGLAAHRFEPRSLRLGSTGRRDLAGVGAKHRKQYCANSLRDENPNGERCKHRADQHNRRNQPNPHKPLALGYDTTKAAPLLSQTECDLQVNIQMPVDEADTVRRIGYSGYWSKKVALR